MDAPPLSLSLALISTLLIVGAVIGAYVAGHLSARHAYRMAYRDALYRDALDARMPEWPPLPEAGTAYNGSGYQARTPTGAFAEHEGPVYLAYPDGRSVPVPDTPALDDTQQIDPPPDPATCPHPRESVQVISRYGAVQCGECGAWLDPATVSMEVDTWTSTESSSQPSQQS